MKNEMQAGGLSWVIIVAVIGMAACRGDSPPDGTSGTTGGSSNGGTFTGGGSSSSAGTTTGAASTSTTTGSAGTSTTTGSISTSTTTGSASTSTTTGTLSTTGGTSTTTTGGATTGGPPLAPITILNNSGWVIIATPSPSGSPFSLSQGQVATVGSPASYTWAFAALQPNGTPAAPLGSVTSVNPNALQILVYPTMIQTFELSSAAPSSGPATCASGCNANGAGSVWQVPPFGGSAAADSVLTCTCQAIGQPPAVATPTLPSRNPANFTQSVSTLQNSYSGQATWDAGSGTLTFTQSGTILFAAGNQLPGTSTSSIWAVPSVVQNIVINANVAVAGQFSFTNDCNVTGQERNTSILYGTKASAWLDNQSLDTLDHFAYAAVYAYGPLTVNLSTLTTLDPIGAMWIGASGAVINLHAVNGVDDRPGFYNHSGAFTAGAGSVVDDCFISNGDDTIMLQQNTTVTNTTINMRQNAVPIQLGWQDSNKIATGVFTNLTILQDLTVNGLIGRGNHSAGASQPAAVITGTSGDYNRIVLIDGLTVNGNVSLLSLDGNSSMQLEMTIANANVSFGQLWSENLGTCINCSINGTAIDTSSIGTVYRGSGVSSSLAPSTYVPPANLQWNPNLAIPSISESY